MSTNKKPEQYSREEVIIDVLRGIEKVAANKTIGIDGIPAEWFKANNHRDRM
jgi:hypothetical protein